ncbi:MAG: phage tail protein [Proteobacteria bacterium]|nr:phage tail protein [Pseudomonadota bacterium]MBU4297612.1 phage tail protein [Pseudomonadota bacterium]MCG2750025.1 phage baseplate assembly protein V [Desulfobulbaceae bacterium]
MSLEKIVSRLVDKVEHRYYGKYRGIVVDNADPEQLGRLKLKVPSILGNDIVSGWAAPCVPYGGEMNQGMLFIPEVNAGVWVEFEEGDLEFPIWVGTFWSKPDGESELPKPNDADGTEQGSVQDPPTRKIIKTVKGHSIQFEDNDGEEMITIVEAVNNHVITLDANGIAITDGAGTITIEDANGNQVLLDSSGITCTDMSGNEIKMDGQGVQLSDANGNAIKMDAMSGFAGPGVKINAGTGRVCMEGLITWLLTHQHVGNLGAPTPLFPGNMSDLIMAVGGMNDNFLSKKLKVE